MTKSSIIIAPPADAPREQSASTLAHIMRGVCAVLPLDSTNANPWDVWDVVARARIHAVDTSHEHSPVFVGQSCLRLLGIRGWSQNPPVTIYRENRRCTSSLPSCSVGSTTVPPTSVSCSQFPPLSKERSRIEGLVVEHPYDALVRSALHDEPLESFVLGCMALNIWSQFSMFHQDECRPRAEEIRAELLARSSRLSIRAAQIRQKLRFCGWYCPSVPSRLKRKCTLGFAAATTT